MLKTIQKQNHHNVLRVIINEDGIVRVVYPDFDEELQDADQIFCPSVRSEPSESQVSRPNDLDVKRTLVPEVVVKNEMIMGLVFVQDAGMEDVYQRVGLMRWVIKFSVF